MVRIIFCLIGLLVSSATIAETTATATIDRNPVMVNESFILEVIVNDSVDANALDTSPLLKDFVVGRTSVSSQTSMINFKTTRTTKFQTVLVARKKGDYIIPALTVENIETQPIVLTVVELNSQAQQKQNDIFITTDISATDVYVQQQITLTIKLHFATELKRGSLSEPALENANILQIGQDKESDTILNGKRFRVIERTYAISPQQSGNFEIQPPVFSGEIMVQSARRSNFLSFGETKPVSVLSDPIPLTVKPVPSNYQGDEWLPSELLTIHQEWQPSPKEFKVGEPITRTITLTAAGLSEEQLPNLSINVPSGIKVYPDQAELHTGMNNGRMVSQKVQSFAIVASKAGEYELPEISIPWWNTVTNKPQMAVIPAQTVTIVPNPDYEQPSNNSIESSSSNEAGQVKSADAIPQLIIEQKTPWLQWVFLSLWLLTTFAWIVTANMKKQPKTKHVKSTEKINDHYLKLMQACKQNDGLMALKLIVPWLNSHFSVQEQVKTLDEAIIKVDRETFSTLIKSLQESYFGKSQSTWNGTELLQEVNSINKCGPKTPETSTFSINP